MARFDAGLEASATQKPTPLEFLKGLLRRTVGGLRLFGSGQTGAGQIEIVGDVGNDTGDVESHLVLAHPASGELITPNRQDLVLGPMVLMNYGI